MKASTYKTIRKIHLYASLPVVVLLLMYVVSSYFMIHYEKFNTYQRAEQVEQISVTTEQVSQANWLTFLRENGISGKMTDEKKTPEGDWVREYSRAGRQYLVTLSASNDLVVIKTIQANIPGFIVGLHRIRGYSGPWQYQVYAVLLDIVGVSLILFAITGAILWLKLLKNDVFAWVIFAAGLIYVGAVMLYLMTV
jgi:hypothetical protein